MPLQTEHIAYAYVICICYIIHVAHRDHYMYTCIYICMLYVMHVWHVRCFICERAVTMGVRIQDTRISIATRQGHTKTKHIRLHVRCDIHEWQSHVAAIRFHVPVWYCLWQSGTRPMLNLCDYRGSFCLDIATGQSAFVGLEERAKLRTPKRDCEDRRALFRYVVVHLE